MIITVNTVQVRDLNLDEIHAEYQDRITPLTDDEDDPVTDDAPTADEMPYYDHRGHRVFLYARDADGNDVGIPWSAENETALRAITDHVNAAITNQAGCSTPTQWEFSRHVGCGRCPCSPGFLVHGPGRPQDVLVELTLHTT